MKIESVTCSGKETKNMEEIRAAADQIKARLLTGAISEQEARHELANLEQALIFATYDRERQKGER